MRHMQPVVGLFHDNALAQLKLNADITGGAADYDLEYGLELFAPQIIFGFAAANVINRPLFSDEFFSGIGTPCLDIFKILVFAIIDKAVPDVQKKILR